MARLSKAKAEEKRREQALADAQRLATVLAATPAESDSLLAAPALLADPRLAPALAVWKELAPTLSATGRLQQLDRMTFASLCYWQAEYVTAVDDILARGYSFMVKATKGGERPWFNPSVQRRDTAWREIMALSQRFGLTPLDRAVLIKARKAGIDPEDELLLPTQSTTRAVPQPEQRPPGKFDGLLPN